MSRFAESLRRLYLNKKIPLKLIKNYYAQGKITEAEYNYIVSREN